MIRAYVRFYHWVFQTISLACYINHKIDFCFRILILMLKFGIIFIAFRNILWWESSCRMVAKKTLLLAITCHSKSSENAPTNHGCFDSVSLYAHSGLIKGLRV